MRIEARGDGLRIADVGTGTGAIAVALACGASRVTVVAVDASEAALAVAHRNARSHALLDRVHLRRGDLLEGMGEFDLILANLPYVSGAEWQDLAPEIRDHEPRAALVGGVTGTEVIERLVQQSPAHLAEDGLLACEIGARQGDRVRDIASRTFPDGDVAVRRDLAALDRVVTVRNR